MEKLINDPLALCLEKRNLIPLMWAGTRLMITMYKPNFSFYHDFICAN